MPREKLLIRGLKGASPLMKGRGIKGEGFKTMASGLGSLIRLQKGQVEPASEVLSRAFIDDPELRQLALEPRERAELLRLLFRMTLSHEIFHGEVYAISPDMEGIAIWLPSGAPKITLWTLLRCGGLTPLFKVSWQSLWRMKQKARWKFVWQMKQDEDFAFKLRQRLAPTPHWYLAVLGVDPRFWGRGYASRLLKPMLARLDAEKLPCYVETDIAGYVSIYQHFGFRVIHEAVLPGTASKMWAMLREKGG